MSREEHCLTRIDESELYIGISDDQEPIIYRDEYNIKFFGLEKLHPFDSGKWGNIVKILKKRGVLEVNQLVHPKEASKSDLKVVHPDTYLQSLKWSWKVAQIIEVPPIALLPNYFLKDRVLKPFKYQTGGSILGGQIALKRGWAINIGGGFHHCSKSHGEGFCVYADITLTICFVMRKHPFVQRILIIDLDAHQGNGYERDFMNDSRIYILDIYNRQIFPGDKKAKEAITRRVELEAYTADEEYLDKVKTAFGMIYSQFHKDFAYSIISYEHMHEHVEGSLNEFQPQLVIYNAGTDILKGDPLGLLCISPQGVIERDEIVWQKVRHRKIPILMLTSGGYQRASANVIADSICNLRSKGLLSSHHR